MSAPTFTEMPDSFFSGESVNLQFSFSEYAATDGWAMTLYLAGKSIGNVVASTSGAKFIVTLSSTFTTALEPGNYLWRAIVTKGSEKIVASNGTVQVHANIAEATAGALQSQAEKDLEVLDALFSNRLTTDMESYQIAGRAVTKIPLRELIDLRATLRREVEALRHPGKVRPQMRVSFTGSENEA